MAKKKKKKSKIRKILGAIGKAALIGGGLYGASKLFGGKGKGAVSTVGQPFGVARTAYKPAHLGETVHKKPYIPDRISSPLRPAIPKREWTGDQSMAPNRSIWNWKAKGGRVTGIAKRGFGRALMKGKK